MTIKIGETTEREKCRRTGRRSQEVREGGRTAGEPGLSLYRELSLRF